MIRWPAGVRLTARGSHEAALSPCDVRPCAANRRARAPIGQLPYTPPLLSSVVHNHPSLPTQHNAGMGCVIPNIMFASGSNHAKCADAMLDRGEQGAEGLERKQRLCLCTAGCTKVNRLGALKRYAASARN